jgi:hypothetical protein
VIYFDTETCGYHGPVVLIQWAEGVSGEINLHSVWNSPIWETLELCEKLTNHPEGVCAFNLAFDWFHICQLYTTLKLLEKKVGPHAYPVEHIEDYARLEPEARMGPCLKPHNALDLFLHARKGPYQSTMDRSDIRIRRIPTSLAQPLADELSVRIPLKDIYFARYKDPTRRWQVADIEDEEGNIIPEFKDVYLKFAPSSALKALAEDVLDLPATLKFTEADVGKEYRPKELGYAPFAMAIGEPGNWKGAWPVVIKIHITHWDYNSIARDYATKDVWYLQQLHKAFGMPPAGDCDSVLAALVGAVRWKGFKIDVPKITALRNKAREVTESVGFNFNSPRVCRVYMEQVLDPTEAMVLQDNNGKISTKSKILEEIAKWKQTDVHEECMGMGCANCDEGLAHSDTPHPAAIRAKEILKARHAKKEVELCEKLLTAKRFHASLKVIGALSSRMSGADGMNPQGIKRSEEFRSAFPLYDEGYELCGGDFESFEVGLMDAAYGDPELRKMLMTGKKIHAIFGTFLFPPKTYEEILATKGLPEEQDLYGRSKNGVFAMAYGGEVYTLQTRVGVTEAAATDAYHRWCKRFKVWGEERQKVFDMFCSMRQPNGIGTKVEWHEPAEYVESMFGFRRYFTLENQICRVLFQLAEDPPKDWQAIKVKVTRRDRQQTACGALRSALFGAAFQIQAANMRAAGNHVIQSAGATTTKDLQFEIWEHQPAGINRWHVQPLNIHDEIMCPALPHLAPKLEKTVADFVTKLKLAVPLAAMDWGSKLKSWASK